jgi:hypothetical protein
MSAPKVNLNLEISTNTSLQVSEGQIVNKDIGLQIPTQYDEYEVSGTTFNLDFTPFGLDFVFNKISPLEEAEIKARFSCFKNGIKMQYYHFTNDPLEPNFYQFYLDQSTNDVVFGAELESDHIEFIFINKT